MQIRPIAHFRSPLTSKFGIPRQSGLAPSLVGTIVFEPEYRSPEAIRGLDAFSHLWLIWEFSEVSGGDKQHHLTVRPPRLGGNERVGVFASRSPFRPNNLGLTCAKIEAIRQDNTLGTVIDVSGADLMDGTPIYDVKPYVRFADSHPEAKSGFVDEREWQKLRVVVDEGMLDCFSESEQRALREILSQDPRPQYHDDAERIYGMPFAGYDVKFRVEGSDIIVVSVEK